MLSPELLNTLTTLPEPLQQEVLHFAQFLAAKHAQAKPEQTELVQYRKAGSMQDMI